MSETQLKVAVQNYIKSIGGFCIKRSDRFSSGHPDLSIWVGRAIEIELKTPTGVVSPIQQWMIDQINEHGGEAYVCRSLEDVKKIIGGWHAERKN